MIFTEKVPVLGQYFVGLRREMTIDKSGHLLFDKDETAFRGILRADGMGRWNALATPWTGSETMSWCVTLEARA